MFNELCLKSDSTFSELLSAYIMDYFKAHTRYIINYFTCKDLTTRKLFYAYVDLMVKVISTADNPEKSVLELNQYLTEMMQDASAEDRKTAEKIITEITYRIKKL